MEAGNQVMASAGGLPEQTLWRSSCLGPSWHSQLLPHTRLRDQSVLLLDPITTGLSLPGLEMSCAILRSKGNLVCLHRATQQAGAGAAGQSAAVSTRRCCGGQAACQGKPRHSRINWQCTPQEVFLHLFYYVVSDAAKSPVLKGYKIRICWKFMSLNASLKKWKLEQKINKVKINQPSDSFLRILNVYMNFIKMVNKPFSW